MQRIGRGAVGCVVLLGTAAVARQNVRLILNFDLMGFLLGTVAYACA